MTPSTLIGFGSALWCLSNLSIAIFACPSLNQNALGFGLLGRSGRRKNPKKAKTTVMMALITNSHLQPANPALPSRVVCTAVWRALESIPPMAWQEW